MRVYGRAMVNGVLTWLVVETDANGDSSLVYVTALCQCLKLSTNESPFWSTSGIPAAQSVIQQVAPDYYVTLTQQAFAGYFASLVISRLNNPTPTYQVSIVTKQGAVINASIPIPT
jgi:hypothetical protein